jgi:hypothetical protein
MAGRERFPAIVTPRTLPRDAQTAVQNIKERLEALEAAHDQLKSTTNQSLFVLQSTTSTSTSTSSGATSYIAGASLILPTAVIFQNSTNVIPADPTIPAQTFGCFGVAISSAPGVGTVAPGQSVQVATAGQVISLTQTLVAFQPVFCAANGQLTQTPIPGVAAIIQVGVMIAPQLMLVAPAPVIISGTAILGQAVDNFLATTDVIWQFNNVTVAARRIVDFVAAAGFTMTVNDDPGNNRVVITFGATSNPGSAQLVEDGWPWGNPDGLVDDEWDLWQYDSLANSSTVTPSILLSVEDGWLDPDDIWDDWEILASIEIQIPGLRSLFLNLEDAWQVVFDDTQDEWDTWQFDSIANPSTVTPSLLLSREDGWYDQDDTLDEVALIVATCTTGWNQNG